ncbi:c-type cytochrome [Roseovarius salis]|uniref:c-type cytochrome n=1 Tax=Roseovarius salis TaxID=3376063 RepID=UPI0037CBA335
MVKQLWTALAALVVAAPALADADIQAGRETYWRYCSSCHGEDADGNGPMRPVLMVPPEDLTVLSEENGGVFPLRRVVERIDGRDPLVSHGSEMPVYGDFFREGGRIRLETKDGEKIRTSGVVADLVAYLEAIQGN